MVAYFPLYNTGLHNKTEVHKLCHATYITEHVYIYTYVHKMPLSTLAVCEHQASISEAESSSPRLAVVLHSAAQEHSPPVQMLREKTKSTLHKKGLLYVLCFWVAL